MAAGKGEELKEIFDYLKLPSAATAGVDWVAPSTISNSISLQAIDTEKPLVPDVTGMSLRDALYLLENKGLKVNFNGRGRVIGQSLSPGSPLVPNATIDLVLG